MTMTCHPRQKGQREKWPRPGKRSVPGTEGGIGAHRWQDMGPEWGGCDHQATRPAGPKSVPWEARGVAAGKTDCELGKLDLERELAGKGDGLGSPLQVLRSMSLSCT